MISDDIQYDQYMSEHNCDKASDTSFFGITTFFLKIFKFLNSLPYKYSNKIIT